MNAAVAKPAEDQEPLLREDRRLLGRLLGEVIEEQAGAATLERIETIRQTAVRFRRAESDAALAVDAASTKRELEAQLDSLPIEETDRKVYPTLAAGRAMKCPSLRSPAPLQRRAMAYMDPSPVCKHAFLWR